MPRGTVRVTCIFQSPSVDTHLPALSQNGARRVRATCSWLPLTLKRGLLNGSKSTPSLCRTMFGRPSAWKALSQPSRMVKARSFLLVLNVMSIGDTGPVVAEDCSPLAAWISSSLSPIRVSASTCRKYWIAPAGGLSSVVSMLSAPQPL
ncbi:hypothetical protein DX914_09525 [Lysobacter silvisoli]|uniref:Uncharacterized protein n=1 Tax=Lysobacter silvisoli TaxID=2293254 RepID=A0A371K622_9GAMM|nr:hypothetical protein DX914_09525 [Lysobacter silvisoli]